MCVPAAEILTGVKTSIHSFQSFNAMRILMTSLCGHDSTCGSRTHTVNYMCKHITTFHVETHLDTSTGAQQAHSGQHVLHLKPEVISKYITYFQNPGPCYRDTILKSLFLVIPVTQGFNNNGVTMGGKKPFLNGK